MEWDKAAKPPAVTAAPAPQTQPTTAPAVAAVDPIDTHLAQLHDRDAKKRRSALSWFAKADVDEAKAPAVSRAIEPYLKDKDFFTHTEAVAAIRKWVTKENSAYFIHVVSTAYDARDATKIPENMGLAIEMLVKLRDPDGVAPIAKLLHKFFNRSEAVVALKKLGPELAEKEVLKYANDKSPDVALAAKEVLDSFKTGSGSLLDQCLADLKSPSAEKRVFAAQKIAKLEVDPKRRKEVAAALEAMMQEKTGRGEALPAMARWGGPENEPGLVKFLSDPDAMMRQVTCQALGAMGTKQSLPALQKAAMDRKPEVAAAAKQAIDAISKRGK
jgi:HEAT repeat protein